MEFLEKAKTDSRGGQETVGTGSENDSRSRLTTACPQAARSAGCSGSAEIRTNMATTLNLLSRRSWWLVLGQMVCSHFWV